MNLRRVVVTALVLSAAVLSLAGCDSSTSVTSPAALSTTPPAAPSSLVGTYDVNRQQDYLIWTASSSASVTAHEIWQYNDNPVVNPGTLVATVAVGSTYIALPRPSENGVMIYRIRARTANGTLSAFSGSITVQRHGAAMEPTPEPGIGGTIDPVVRININ